MKTEIEIDVCADVEVKGLSRSLYLGEGACEPAFEDVESWEEIVERNIGYYICPGSETISSVDMKELEKTVAGLEHAIVLFKEKMEQYKE
jgi:hypothetical protein